MDTDVNRKIKKEPPLSMECDVKVDLFPRREDGEGKEGEEGVAVKGGDLVSELWRF